MLPVSLVVGELSIIYQIDPLIVSSCDPLLPSSFWIGSLQGLDATHDGLASIHHGHAVQIGSFDSKNTLIILL